MFVLKHILWIIVTLYIHALLPLVCNATTEIKDNWMEEDENIDGRFHLKLRRRLLYSDNYNSSSGEFVYYFIAMFFIAVVAAYVKWCIEMSRSTVDEDMTHIIQHPPPACRITDISAGLARPRYSARLPSGSRPLAPPRTSTSVILLPEERQFDSLFIGASNPLFNTLLSNEQVQRDVNTSISNEQEQRDINTSISNEQVPRDVNPTTFIEQIRREFNIPISNDRERRDDSNSMFTAQTRRDFNFPIFDDQERRDVNTSIFTAQIRRDFNFPISDDTERTDVNASIFTEQVRRDFNIPFSDDQERRDGCPLQNPTDMPPNYESVVRDDEKCTVYNIQDGFPYDEPPPKYSEF